MTSARTTRSDPRDVLPDARDGLTRRERIVLWCLGTLQRERKGRNVPTAMLYGHVVEHIDMSGRRRRSPDGRAG
jgi:hypothetical protein